MKLFNVSRKISSVKLHLKLEEATSQGIYTPGKTLDSDYILEIGRQIFLLNSMTHNKTHQKAAECEVNV
jgi:hypothetical protein